MHPSMFDHAVLIDYGSTDNSKQIIQDLAPSTWSVISMQPGFWDIRSREVHFLSSVYRHRQALGQSRQVFHAAPWGGVPPTQKHIKI